jgi:DNA repair protein RadC
VRRRAIRAADPGVATRSAVNDAEDAARIARPVMLDEQETFVVLCLTVRNTLIGEPHVIAIGTVTGVEVHPRDVFRAAVAANAAGIVVLHNHPSGDLTPSAEDIQLTRRLKACGDLLGIPVVDHVVVTRDRHGSITC